MNILFLNITILIFNKFICNSNELYLNICNMSNEMRNYSYNNENSNTSDSRYMKPNTCDAQFLIYQCKQSWLT